MTKGPVGFFHDKRIRSTTYKMKESKLSQAKKSLPLKLGAGLIGGATLIVCVGALTLPAQAASKCEDNNKISQCVTDSALQTALVKALDNAKPAGHDTITAESLIKDTKEYKADLTGAAKPTEAVKDLTGLGTFNRITKLDLSVSQAAADSAVRDLSELSNLNDLEYLDISNLPTVYGLSQLKSKDRLKVLKFNSNGTQRLDDVSDVRNFRNLTDLSLENQNITDTTAIGSLTKLTNLDLKNNKISNVNPLTNLSSLSVLNLNDNEIRDVTPLTGMISLADAYEANESQGLTATEQKITITPSHVFDKKADWVVDGVKMGAAYARIQSANPASPKSEIAQDFSKVTWAAPASYSVVSYNFEDTVSTTNFRKIGHYAGTVKQNRALVQRLSGNDRYDTMGEIVDESYPAGTDPSTVVVASGDNFPDALAASGLSGLVDGPIVLTNSYRLSARADGELSRLNPAKVIIVGGESAVSDAVKSQIENKVARNAKVVRVAGDTRRDTANEIFTNAKKLSGMDWSSKTAIIATGENFTDALSISAFARLHNAPVFLSGKSGLDASTVRDIKGYGFKSVIIAGGPSAVPGNVIGQLKTAGIKESNVTRLGGATRYQTSLEIAKYATGVTDDPMVTVTPVFATGENFPDALAGGVLAETKHNPLILVSPDTSVNHEALNWINSRNPDGAESAYVLGGENAVSTAVSDDISSTLSFRE